MSKKTLGVGVIGLGWMGRLHARSFKRLKEYYPELDCEIRLVAAADPSTDAQKEATGHLGFETAYANYRHLLENPNIDIVSICSPNFLHHEIAMAAIKAGKPFWIEKPMGVNVQESAEIARGAAEANLITAVGFNYRHTPAIEMARKLVRDGRLGQITNVRCWLLADYASSPFGPLTWRYSRKQAGAGVVGDLMSHGADLVQYLCGPIESVTAMTGTFIPDRPIPTKIGVGHGGWEVSDELGPVENEDYVAILGKLNSGILATMESCRVSVGPRAEYVIEIYGTDGSVKWNFERLNELEVCIGKDNEFQGYTRTMAGPTFPWFSKFQPGPGVSMGFDDLKAIEAAQFIKSVLTGKQIAPSAADAWSAAAIDEATVASATDGKWHTVETITENTTFGK